MGFLSNLSKKDYCTDKNSKYYGYSNDLRQFCEHRDNYQNYWNLAGEYTQKINNYYSEFINNNLSEYNFNLLLEYCNKYIEIVPILKKAQIEENKINNTDYKTISYCIGYHKLALAYEKLNNYSEAIKICKKAIDEGFYDDKTKGGFKGRIKRLDKKQKNN